jgi:hypothetical protein
MARKYAILEGTIDGVNRTFTLPSGQVYVSGSLTLIHNGLTIHQTDTFGFAEVNSTTILLNIAPQTSDVLLAFFDDSTVEETALDVQITGNTLTFETEWNAQQYKVEYDVSLAKLEYNTQGYSLQYNTNSFTIGED